MPTKVAVIERPLVMYDKRAIIARVADPIDKAVSEGASLITFPRHTCRVSGSHLAIEAGRRLLDALLAENDGAGRTGGGGMKPELRTL